MGISIHVVSCSCISGMPLRNDLLEDGIGFRALAVDPVGCHSLVCDGLGFIVWCPCCQRVWCTWYETNKLARGDPDPSPDWPFFGFIVIVFGPAQSRGRSVQDGLEYLDPGREAFFQPRERSCRRLVRDLTYPKPPRPTIIRAPLKSVRGATWPRGCQQDLFFGWVCAASSCRDNAACIPQ